MSYSFELRPEHLKLLPELAFEVRFDTVYDDEVVPAINPKRPFGNSGVTDDVCRRLRFKRDADGKYSREDELRAMHIIAELPFALAYVLRSHNFKPGKYALDENEYSEEIFGLRKSKNYLAVYPALLEIRGTGISEELYKRIRDVFICNCTDDPFIGIPFLESCLDKDPEGELGRAIGIFKKHKAEYERKGK